VEAARTQGHGQDAGATRILVVDDDTQVRAVAVNLLEEFGYGVVEASGGAEALRLLGEGERFDLLLTDYAMPGMTGTELVARARALEPALGVLLMTGYADAAALPSEGVPVLRKPFALDELRVAVERLRAEPSGRVLPFRREDAPPGEGGHCA
jgi:CheY-like chemotaxis protein